MILQLIEDVTREAERCGLQFMIIGGHALIHHGYARMTMDLDLLAREAQRESWRRMIESFGYQGYEHAAAFIQFACDHPGRPPIDIMFVMDDTWGKLHAEANVKTSRSVSILVPSPRHLVALKLHAASSPTRSTPGKDWVDVEEIVRRHRLDPGDPEFEALVLRFGGEEALARVRALWKTIHQT